MNIGIENRRYILFSGNAECQRKALHRCPGTRLPEHFARLNVDGAKHPVHVAHKCHTARTGVSYSDHYEERGLFQRLMDRPAE